MEWRRLPISAFLRKSEEWVHPELEQIYQQIRVRLWGKGLTLRAKVAGANIASRRQLRASAGQFLISRIDARHGAFGIVPDHLDGSLVSNDFPCFDIDERVVLPSYLEWYSRTDRFVELCRRASEGSTNRVRLKEDRFMAIQIPVPNLGKQRQLVERLNRVALLMDQVTSLREDIQTDRTALLVNLAHRPDIEDRKRIAEGWQRVPLKEIMSPAAEPCTVQPDATYPNLGVYSYAKGAFAKPPIDGSSTSAKTLYQVRKGQFMYSRLFAFEGAYAIVPAELDGRFVSSEFPSFDIRENMATPGFVSAYFQDRRVWTDFSADSIGLGSRRQRVNQRHLLEQFIWLPPLGWQRQIGRVLQNLAFVAPGRRECNKGSLMAATLDETIA